MMRRILLLLLVLATAPSARSEEAGAKAIFKDPLLNALSFSSPAEERDKKPEPRTQLRPEPPKAPKAPAVRPPSPAPKAELVRPIGIRSWIQRVDGQGRVLGEMGVGQIFRSGDRIQLLVETNTEGYLAVVHHGSDGRAGLLFPAHERELGTNRLPSHGKVVLPGPRHAFTFEGQAGTERLLVVLVRDREELVALPLHREMSQADLAAVRRVAARELGAKNLVIEALADPDDEPGLYTVNLTGGAIVQEVALVHEH